MLYVDSTAIKAFTNCRELYRLTQVENLARVEPAPALELGIATHLGIESFWTGKPFTEALEKMAAHMLSIDMYAMRPKDRESWGRALEYYPDLLAYYFDHVTYEPDQLLDVEGEWHIDQPYGLPVVLCGRKDRVMKPSKLIDSKTASEIGATWKKDYREAMLMDWGLWLYDWQLCQIGQTPTEIELEVLVKPYRDKPIRLERFQMNEIALYRKRTEQQLKQVLADIIRMADSGMVPWQMATDRGCRHKYGTCDMLPRCLYGKTPQVEKLYTIRHEHLDIRKASA